MAGSRASIDSDRITDWPSFHEEFARAFGFPEFYGKNMDAWIDCLTDLDANTGMTTVDCGFASVVVLELWNVKSFRQRCTEQHDALIECAAFVNWRRIEKEQPAVLALSFWN